MALVSLPRQFLVDVNGTPRIGAKLYIYAPTTTDPITAYTTAAYAVAHSTPILSVSSGFFPAVYVNPSVNPSYKIVVKDASDVTIYTEDNIPAGPSQSDIGAVLNPLTADEESADVTPASYAYITTPVVDARRYGISDTQSAAYNSAAIQDAVAASTGFRTIILPSGVLPFDSTRIQTPVHIIGAGSGKHGSGGNQGKTVIQCVDPSNFAWILERSQLTGYDPFHVQGIRFFGNQVGYGGLHFGPDTNVTEAAAGTDYSNITGLIEDCSFGQFTTYGLALRRVFDTHVRRVNCTEIRNTTTLSTTGRGIALLANAPNSSAVKLDQTVVTIDNCDTSNNHIGLYVEECEVLRIINHQASGNNREGIRFFSRELINNVKIEGGYFEQNNASRNDAGHGGSYPKKYFDMDFERDTSSTKASTYMFGFDIDNPHFGSLSANSGKIHMQHTYKSKMWLRNTSSDGNNIAIGNDAGGWLFLLTTEITPYIDATSVPNPVTVIVDAGDATAGSPSLLISRGVVKIGTNAKIAADATNGVRISNHDASVDLLQVSDTAPSSGDTALLVARNVSGTTTLQRVTMGAADSGGAGFKLLRVAN